ncbi:PBK family protein [Megaselia abdita]
MSELQTPSKILRNKFLENVQNGNNATPLKIPASPMMKSLGFGTGVNVYKYDRSPRSGIVRSPWAIKKIAKKYAMDSSFEARFQNEASILRKLNHPNIIGFRALNEIQGSTTLALECGGKSLGDILEERMEEEMDPLPFAYVNKTIKDILKGLDYLHNTAKILHADVKSYNVLVNGDFEICKLCDFGVSLPMDGEGNVNFKKHPELKFVGTPAWCAPEALDDCEIIDCKADIFSFGMVIYEMLAGIPPHTAHIMDDDDSFASDDKENSTLNVDGTLYGTRPLFPDRFELKDDYHVAFELFCVCSVSDADDRPTAKELLSVLDEDWGILHENY